MFAVGALDAYFCDGYTDIVAATIISKNRHPAMVLPESKMPCGLIRISRGAPVLAIRGHE
jgi:hypothetical protein